MTVGLMWIKQIRNVRFFENNIAKFYLNMMYEYVDF